MASPTLKDYRDSYVAASLKAGDIARQLAFAGIALIWIFQRTAKEVNDLYRLPEELYWPALFIVISLVFDLLQYCSKSAIWGFIQRKIEKDFGPDVTQSYLVSEYFNWPTLVFFWGKLITIIIAYVGLLFFVVVHVKFSQSTDTSVTPKFPVDVVRPTSVGRDGSRESLSNNVTISISGEREKTKSDSPMKSESPKASDGTSLQNNVTITLPSMTKTIVQRVPVERNEPCKPCDRQEK